MTIHQSAFNDSQGMPNIEALQYYLENWGIDEIAHSFQTCKFAVTADATGGLDITDIPDGAEIIDVVVLCTASNGSGTLTLKDGEASPNSISNAIACDTNHAIARAGTINDSYNVVNANKLQVVANGAGDRGIICIHYIK